MEPSSVTAVFAHVGGKVWIVAQHGSVTFFVPMYLTLLFCCVLSFSHPSISRLMNDLRELQGKLPFHSYIRFSHSGSLISQRDAYWISIGGQNLSILSLISFTRVFKSSATVYFFRCVCIYEFDTPYCCVYLSINWLYPLQIISSSETIAVHIGSIEYRIWEPILRTISCV